MSSVARVYLIKQSNDLHNFRDTSKEGFFRDLNTAKIICDNLNNRRTPSDMMHGINFKVFPARLSIGLVSCYP